MGVLNMALALLPAVGQMSVYFLRHTLVCFLKHRSGAEQAEKLVSGSGAGGHRAGNGAESGSHKIGLSGERKICR